MEKEILENHKNYVERLGFYRSFGYDLEKERGLILEVSSPFSGRILEIGTGKGHFALALAKRGFSFTSIDISEEEQKVARLNLEYHGLEKRATFVIEDAHTIRFPNESFDTIFSVNVFHHLDDPDTVLHEMARLIRPAGKIVLSDFNENGFDIINACHTREGKTHDRSKHDLREAYDFFTERGFSMSEFRSEVQRTIIAEDKIIVV